MARTKPWKASDEVWERVRPLIPARPPHPKGGRPAKDDRPMFEAIGWTATHKTPESLQLTTSPPPPMLGISGLLNLLTWVEHRQRAQASPHEEGGIPCPVSHPTRLPPTRFQPGNQSVGGSAPGQSEASSLAAESSARTPTGTRPHTRQGGRR